MQARNSLFACDTYFMLGGSVQVGVDFWGGCVDARGMCGCGDVLGGCVVVAVMSTCDGLDVGLCDERGLYRWVVGNSIGWFVEGYDAWISDVVGGRWVCFGMVAMWQGSVYHVWQAMSVDVGSGSAFVSGCWVWQWASFRCAGDLPIGVPERVGCARGKY